MLLTDAAKAKRNAYQREYYRNNREEMLAKQREWRQNNPEKVQAYQATYWERKTQQEGV